MEITIHDRTYHISLSKKEREDLRIIADLFGFSIDAIARESGCHLDLSANADWVIHRVWKIHEVIELYLDYKYNKNVDDFRCEGTGSSNSGISQ